MVDEQVNLRNYSWNSDDEVGRGIPSDQLCRLMVEMVRQIALREFSTVVTIWIFFVDIFFHHLSVTKKKCGFHCAPCTHFHQCGKSNAVVLHVCGCGVFWFRSNFADEEMVCEQSWMELYTATVPSNRFYFAEIQCFSIVVFLSSLWRTLHIHLFNF